MREHRFTVPELALIAGSRHAGSGDRPFCSRGFASHRRRDRGRTLVVIGAVSTIRSRCGCSCAGPAAAEVSATSWRL